MNKLKISVLFGGKSNEHDVSVSSGEQIIKNLDSSEYLVKPVLISKDGVWFIPKKHIVPSNSFSVENWIKNINDVDFSSNISDIETDTDLAFLALHGKYGEDGSVQGFLEMVGLNYTGSKVLSSSVAFNKAVSKYLYVEHKIPTPKFVVLKEEKNFVNEIENKIGLPCVIKPSESGSSFGVYVCHSKEDVISAFKQVSGYKELVAEEYVKGDEFSCGILEINGKVELLPPTQIIPKDADFFDFESKYNPFACDEITPACISKELAEKLQQLAYKSHVALGCRGYSRTDIIVKNDAFYVLETNTLPGMTENSIFPKQAKAMGISYKRLLNIIIKESIL